MTATQQQQYTRGLEIARRDALTVLAHGTRKSDGARIWGVTSKSTHDYRLHQVVEVASRLICDCPSRVICKHRGLVHSALVAEAAAAKAAAQAAQPGVAKHETAPLYRSNAAISMWK